MKPKYTKPNLQEFLNKPSSPMRRTVGRSGHKSRVKIGDQLLYEDYSDLYAADRVYASSVCMSMSSIEPGAIWQVG